MIKRILLTVWLVALVAALAFAVNPSGMKPQPGDNQSAKPDDPPGFIDFPPDPPFSPVDLPDPDDDFPLPEPPLPMPDWPDDDPFDGLPDPPPFPEDDFPFDEFSDGTLSIIDSGAQLGYSPAATVRGATAPFLGHVEFSPEPLPLPFYPAFTGPARTGTLTARPCSSNPQVHVFFPGRTSMSVLAVCPWRVVTTIQLGWRPATIRLNPAGNLLLVTSRQTSEAALVDPATFAVTKIPLRLPSGSSATPGAATFSADGTRAFIANHDFNNPFVLVLDIATSTVVAGIRTGLFPGAVELSPDGYTVWVSCRGDNTVHIYETLTYTELGTLTNVIEPLGMAFNPTGTRIYIAAAPDLSPGSIEVYDTDKLTRIASITVGNIPRTVLMSPSGRHVAVGNVRSNFISLIDTSTNKLAGNIKTRRGSRALGFFH